MLLSFIKLSSAQSQKYCYRGVVLLVQPCGLSSADTCDLLWPPCFLMLMMIHILFFSKYRSCFSVLTWRHLLVGRIANQALPCALVTLIISSIDLMTRSWRPQIENYILLLWEVSANWLTCSTIFPVWYDHNFLIQSKPWIQMTPEVTTYHSNQVTFWYYFSSHSNGYNLNWML